LLLFICEITTTLPFQKSAKFTHRKRTRLKKNSCKKQCPQKSFLNIQKNIPKKIVIYGVDFYKKEYPLKKNCKLINI